MNSRLLRLTFLSVVCLTVLVGCPSELEKYLAEYKLQAFNPPRSTDGVGTIIDFKDGHESIVASADECISAAKVPHDPHTVATLTSEYTVSRDMGVDLSLAKGLVKNLDLTAAFEDKSVDTVRIKLTDPFEERMTRQSLSTYLDKLPPADPCRAHFEDSSNFVINYVLGAKGVSYSLVDKSGTSIKLNANILGKISVDPKFTTDNDGKYSLEFQGLIYIGYSAWTVTTARGVSGEVFSVQDVPLKTLGQLRAASSRS